ncbi:MAG: histidine--tRNA ligase [Candidatus Aquicultorales bacterium]
MKYKAPKGTYDVLPDKGEKLEFLEEMARDLFKLYGYRPIQTPIFESTDVFARGIGEATDIVQKEMYTFEDKGGRSLTLRPEGTAPIVRAFVEHSMVQLSQPVKLYYSGAMFRYERPQSGRYRQFYQIGVEALGSDDPALDAEVIVLMVKYFNEAGVREMNLLINSMGCPKDRPAYIEALKEYARGRLEEVCGECSKRLEVNPLRLFDCKREECRASMAGAPKIVDYLCPECEAHFKEVRGFLDKELIEYVIEPILVRGLDYYTKTTFEIQSKYLGAQNAVGGGGRYDRLVEELGGSPTPAIGFALGIERLAMAVEAESGEMPGLFNLDAFVVTVDESVRPEAFKLAEALRDEGLVTEMDFMGRSVKAQIKLAGKLGAGYSIFLGPEELAKGRCTVKDMDSGEQEEVALDKAAEYIGDKLFEELGGVDD